MLSTSVTLHPDYPADVRTLEARYVDDGAVSVRITERDSTARIATDFAIHGTPRAVLATIDELRAAVLAALPEAELANIALAELQAAS